APPTARVAEPFKARLIVAPGKSPSELTARVQSESRTDYVVSQSARVGAVNEAVFAASCGLCFVATGPSEQAYAGRELTWEWIVTPPTEKDIDLIVSLWVKVADLDKNAASARANSLAKTLEARVSVNVVPSVRLREFVADNWQWILATGLPALAAAVTWLWRRTRQRERIVGFH